MIAGVHLDEYQNDLTQGGQAVPRRFVFLHDRFGKLSSIKTDECRINAY